MLTLVVMVLLGWAMAVFATQNTGMVQIGLGEEKFGLPVYGVVLGSLLVGMLITGGLGIINSVSSALTMHGKDNKLREAESEIARLREQVRQMEGERKKSEPKKKEALTES